MNEYILDIFKNYIKKHVLIESYFEMESSAFNYAEEAKNKDKNNSIDYRYTIVANNKIDLFGGDIENVLSKIGSIEFLEKEFIISLPKKYIKRSYYNSINNLFYKEEFENDMILNLKYIENLPKWILSNKDKTELFYSDKDIIIEKLKITLEQMNLIFVNKKDFKNTLYYSINFYENDYEYKKINIINNRFRKDINKKISEIYTLNKFGKNFNRLSKKELKVLEIENY